jgi:hypothetical protein
VFAVALLGALPVAANERHFNHTYESSVLNPGDAEIEPWTTWRYGRKSYYSRFDHRLEYEVGVVPGLQTALYWNFRTQASDSTLEDGTTVRQLSTKFKSVSSEWKYKLLDPVADPLGLALYAEGSLGPGEAELEAKLIVDKQLGQLLLAANLIGEREWKFEQVGNSYAENKLDVAVGVGYVLTGALVAGVELVQTNTFADGELETSALYGGPSLSVASKKFWISASVLPQLVPFTDASEGSRLDLDHQERLRTRLIVGLHL